VRARSLRLPLAWLGVAQGRLLGELRSPQDDAIVKIIPPLGRPQPVQPASANTRNNPAGVALPGLLHAGFVLTGVVNTMLGPLLPVLAAKWRLNDSQAGSLFTSQFAGSMLGVMASSLVVPRWGSRVSLVLGLGMMALGTGTLGLGTSIVGIISAFGFGIGLGLAIPTTNLLVSDLNPDKRAAALNLVNLSWGMGAVGCPFVVARLQGVHRTSLLLYGTALLLLILAAILTRFSFGSSDARGARKNNSILRDGKIWRSRYVPILGAIFFLYVGSETAVGGWTASYARRMMSDGGTAWAMMPSFFWATLLLGRAIAPVLLRRLPELTLARMGLGLGALSVIGLHSAKNLSGLAVSVSCAGLGFSTVYPIAIAMLSHRFGVMASRIAGLMFTLAGLGGATLPWLVGFASTEYGSLKFGLLVPLGGCIGMLVMYGLLPEPGQDLPSAG
jgi:FHS family glucose/mannose:H+ symporter-like MFS transporter